jgi:glycine/serine hydroxymethyltransferase
MATVGRLIAVALREREDDAALASVRAEVNELCARYPLY